MYSPTLTIKIPKAAWLILYSPGKLQLWNMGRTCNITKPELVNTEPNIWLEQPFLYCPGEFRQTEVLTFDWRKKTIFKFLFLYDWTVNEVAYQPAQLLCIYDSPHRKSLTKTKNPLSHCSASIKRYLSLTSLFLILSLPIICLWFFPTWISPCSFLARDSLNSDFLEDCKRKQRCFYPPLLSTKESFEFVVCSKFGKEISFACGCNIILSYLV